MSDPGEGPGSGDEIDRETERRYRAVLKLDPALQDSISALVEALGDPEWRVRAAAADRLAEAPPPSAIPPLVNALVSDEVPARKSGAAGALAQIGPAAIGALQEAMVTASPDGRTAVVEVLGEIGDQQVASTLATSLLDPDPNVRAAAAEALGKVGGPAAIAALEETLARGGEDQLHYGVLEALGRIGKAPPAALLSSLVENRALRRSVVALAGESDDPAAWKLMVTYLADPSRGVREAAVEGIGRYRVRREEIAPAMAEAIRGAVAAEPEILDGAVESLSAESTTINAGALTVLQLVPDSRYAVRIAELGENERIRPFVSKALVAMGPGIGAAIQPELRRLGPTSRAVVLRARADVGDPEVLPDLLAALRADDETVRALALDGLGSMADLGSVPPLLALLEEPDPNLSGAAVTALAALAHGSPEGRGCVLDALRKGNEPVGAASFRLLARIGEAADWPRACAGLKTAHRGTRIAAAGALAAIGARVPELAAPVPELLDAVDDPDPTVRSAAVKALGALARASRAQGKPEWDEARWALLVALHDEEPSVRAAAAFAIGRAGAVECVPALTKLATDLSGASVAVAAAIHALAELRRAGPELLDAAFRHEDPEVVKEVVRAAAPIQGEATLSILLRAAAHDRWDVRCVAATELGLRDDAELVEVLRELRAKEKDPLVAESFEASLRMLEDLESRGHR